MNRKAQSAKRIELGFNALRYTLCAMHYVPTQSFSTNKGV
jgi:hypothetical protein